MLTNIFYYNIYKPYILKASNSERTAPVSAQTKYLKPEDSRFNLNKANKLEVINYARDLSSGVVSIKDAAKNLIASIKEYNGNVQEFGREEALEWLTEDAEAFLESFNTLDSFASSQTHSNELSLFAEDNRWNLSEFGTPIFLFNGSELSLKHDALAAAAENDVLDGVVAMSENIYKSSLVFLQKPLSNHMNFKTLGYYYNYKLGSYSDNTFLLIESGTLLNKIV